jgi:hypothetical protein
VKGFETRRSDWPDSARQFMDEMIDAKLFEKPIRDIIVTYRDLLFTGQLDEDLVTRTSLRSPIEEYDSPLPHTRAAEQIREEYGHEEVRVGDKIPYVKYGSDKTDVVHAFDGIGTDFRPNEGYCSDCDEVVRRPHDHDTVDHPRLRDQHYSYVWKKKFKTVMNRLDIHEYNQTGLQEFA